MPSLIFLPSVFTDSKLGLYIADAYVKLRDVFCGLWDFSAGYISQTWLLVVPEVKTLGKTSFEALRKMTAKIFIGFLVC